MRNNTVAVCKCHGISGSCTLKTCWKALQPFKRTADTIDKKYRSAVKISADIKLLPVRKQFRRLKKFYSRSFRGRPFFATLIKDIPETAEKRKQQNILDRQLIYRDQSPDFCSKPYGVPHRPCSPSLSNRSVDALTIIHQKGHPRSTDSCETLCCHHGYYVRLETIVEKCNCDISGFVVKCDQCIRKVLQYYCYK